MPQRSRENDRDRAAEARLAKVIGEGLFSTSIHGFRQVPSTMDVAAELAEAGQPEGALVWAAVQERGRGRLGRAWFSPEGGLYLSVVLRPKAAVDRWPQLSLVAGLAAAEAVHEVTRLEPRIRWPNDLLVNGSKVAGILVEGKGNAVIAGIGINVTSAIGEIPDTGTSLAECGAACDLFQMAGAFCNLFEAKYCTWAALGFAPIRKDLNHWMGSLGGIVRLTQGEERIEGQALDIDEEGRLLVRRDAGMIQAFDVGDVSLLR